MAESLLRHWADQVWFPLHGFKPLRQIRWQREAAPSALKKRENERSSSASAVAVARMRTCVCPYVSLAATRLSYKRPERVRYLARQPRPPLGDVVDHLWSLSDAPGHARERVVPSGTIELVINLHEDEFRIYEPVTGRERRFRGAIASGCYSAAFEIDTRAHSLVLGVHFKPGGAGRLLGVPPGALANAHVGLDDLWGRAATELRERLFGAPSLRQRIEFLEQALIARLPQRPHRRPAVRAGLAELDQPGVEVGHVARVLCLSRRRFIEVFTQDVGMTPKRYSMVRRFQRALALTVRSPSAAWAQIALECGYCDQAHLCRDWAELTGLSPGKFLALRGIQVKENHVALPEAGVKSIQYASPSRK
jgi:AraC-like DNA-binding protein